MDKNQKLITGLLALSVAVSVFSYASLNSRIISLSNQNNFLEQQISSMRSEIPTNISNQVNSSIDNMLEISKSNIDTYDVTYDNINPDSRTADINFTFSLLSSENIESIKVSVKPENSSEEVFSKNAESSDGIHYFLSASLPYSENYELFVYGEKSDGSVKKMNYMQIFASMNSEIGKHTMLLRDGVMSSGKKTIVKFKLSNKTFGLEGFSVKDVKVKYFSDDGSEEKFINPTEFKNETEYSEYGNDEEIQRRSEPDVSIAERVGDAVSTEEDTETKYYAVTIQADSKKEHSVYLYDGIECVTVTFANGETAELY